MSGPDEKNLAERLWSARSVDDVAWILDAARSSYGKIETVPVGGRHNNSGIVRVSSDPMLALVERITNAIDACLELEALKTGETVGSPREGARRWFRVPDAGLTAMSAEERRALAQNITVILEDSGEPKRPSIVVSDRGIGLHPDEFAGTILSLNESNKVQAPYTMGIFGQGGSATLGFARSTIFISRCYDENLDGRADRVGWTVATEIFDERTMKVPSYVFYKPKATESVFSLDPALFPELSHGTRIIHVSYDAQRGATAYTTGAWQILNATLFDPVLPFVLGGDRKSVDPEWRRDHTPTRIITGTATRLSGEDVGGGQIELTHTDSHQIDLGSEYGEVGVSYWALRRPEDSTSSSPEIARSYVEPSAAVSITLFGQRQDATHRTWIKDQVKLPFLYKNMVVQIDADRLTGRARREVFASTRERATDSDLKRRIYDEVAEILRGDEVLRYLNHEEKERLLKKSSDATNERVRKRLAKFVKTKLKDQQREGRGGGDGEGGGGHRTTIIHAPSPPRDTSDAHLPNFPTEMRFNKDRVTVRQGRKTSVWLHLNAKNGYLPAHDDELSIAWSNADARNSPRVATRSTLGGGKSSWHIAAEPDTPLGDYKLMTELVTPGGLLTAQLSVAVAAPVPARPVKRGTEPETGPEVKWVRKDDWEIHEFTERSVGRVTEDDESTIIFVNRDYRQLEHALSDRHLTADQIATRADRYQYPVACALWLQNHEVQKLSETARPPEGYLNSELERVAEAVLVASDPDVSLTDDGGNTDG